MLIESDDPLVMRDGIWTAQDTPSASGGSYLYASGSPADVLTLEFEGLSVEIIYVKHPAFGTLAIEIDGVVVRTVITTAQETEFDARAAVNYLEAGPHVLRVYAAEGTIAVDAFVAIPATSPILLASPLVQINGRILYRCPISNFANLCVYNTDGSTSEFDILGNLQDTIQFPAWTPDGRHIIFYWLDSQSGNYLFNQVDSSSIVSQSGFGSTNHFPRTFTSRLDMTDSPAGAKFVYSANPQSTPNQSTLYSLGIGYCTVPPLCPLLPHTALLPLQLGIQRLHPTWSPTGTEIIFESNEGGVWHFYRLNLATSDYDPLNYPNPPANFRYTQPLWSPDGTRVVFVEELRLGSTLESSRIKVLNLNNGDIQIFPVPLTGKGDSAPDWSPDSSQIVFVRRDLPSGTNPQIHILDVATGTVTYLINGDQPRWEPPPTLMRAWLEAELATYGITVREIGRNWTDSELQAALFGVEITAQALYRFVIAQGLENLFTQPITTRSIFNQIMGNFTFLRALNNDSSYASSPTCENVMDKGCTDIGNHVVGFWGTMRSTPTSSLNPFVVTHELGHRFDGRKEGEPPLLARLVNQTTCGNMAQQKLTPLCNEPINYSIRDNANRIVMGIRQGEGFYWRERGWGSWAPVNAQGEYQESTFRQDIRFDYEEIAADMFLNWVYYYVDTPYGRGFKDRTWDRLKENSQGINCSQVQDSTGTYVGCEDPTNPGQARFEWMQDKVEIIIRILMEP